MEVTNAKRVVYRVIQHLEDVPERIFPLLCPVREYDWIDGWSCAMIYAETGRAELGGIFRTAFPDLGDEIWTITRYEPPLAIEFVRVAWNVAVVKLDIALEPDGNRRTRVRMAHTYTALSRFLEFLCIPDSEIRMIRDASAREQRVGRKRRRAS